jgi:hypothetical protein
VHAKFFSELPHAFVINAVYVFPVLVQVQHILSFWSFFNQRFEDVKLHRDGNSVFALQVNRNPKLLKEGWEGHLSAALEFSRKLLEALPHH